MLTLKNQGTLFCTSVAIMVANYMQNRRLAWRVGDGTKIYCWKGRRVYGMIVIDHALPSLSNTNFGKEKTGSFLLELWLTIEKVAHYWNGGYTIEKVAHYWNGGYTIGMVAILLK